MSPRQNKFYFDLWRKACQANHWNQSDDGRRHELHRQALGYDCSHKNFNQAEFDRIITAFKLAANPLDLDQVIESDHPELGDRRRLLWSVEHSAPRPYIESLSTDRFGTARYEELSNDDLNQLRLILFGRARARKRKGQLALV
jgi:hypothetical protein